MNVVVLVVIVLSLIPVWIAQQVTAERRTPCEAQPLGVRLNRSSDREGLR